MMNMSTDGKKRKKRVKRLRKGPSRVIKKKRAFPTEVTIDGKRFQTKPDHLEPLKIPKEFVPVTDGMKWKCLKCGWCCSQNWKIDITWKDFRKIVGDKWSPGQSAPFDPIASRKGDQLGLKVIIANGTKLKNLEKIFNDEKYNGTTIN